MRPQATSEVSGNHADLRERDFCINFCAEEGWAAIFDFVDARVFRSEGVGEKFDKENLGQN